jgi:hypothetical protein
MTPKEKAIELFEKMAFSCRECDYESNAKQCALIAVDEIIQGYEFDSLDIEHKRIIDNINYWDKVKQEIEKL